MKTQIEAILSGRMTFGTERVFQKFDMKESLKIVKEIGKHFTDNFILPDDIYRQLILWAHASKEFNGDINKGILLMGKTGTGKTLAMNIIKTYIEFKRLYFLKDKETRFLNFSIYNSFDVVTKFLKDDFPGVDMYCKRYIACFDDLGAENGKVKRYGNEVDIMGYILTERYNKKLLTLGTTNFPLNVLADLYSDRVVSRMHTLFNFIEMKGKDFRKVC